MKKLLLLTLIAFAVGIALSTVGYLLSRDCPPPQDDDLRVQRLDIPEKENAFYYFELAADELAWPDDEETKQRVDAMLKQEQWDGELADELIQKNSATFKYIEQGLACAHLQVPEIKSIDALIPYLAPWRDLARLTSLRVLWFFKQGKEKEAFDEAMKAVKFGHMIEGSKGRLIHYLMGMAVKEIGLNRMRAMIPDTGLQPELLKGYAEALANYEANEEGLADTFRVEYMVQANVIDDVASGVRDLDLGKVDMEERNHTKKGYSGYFFQPNKTKRLLAEMYRGCISNIPRTWAERDYSGPPEPPEDPGFLIVAKYAISGNAIGEILVPMLAPAMEGFQSAKCRIDLSVSITRLLLALKAYKTDTGELPLSLDELVPDYVDAVPQDPFDGRPIRYSREDKILYSVGEDLVDSGGSEKEEWDDPDEPTFRIKF